MSLERLLRVITDLDLEIVSGLEFIADRELAESQPAKPTTEPVVAPTKPTQVKVESTVAAAPKPEMLLASLADMPLPRYAIPPGADRLEWISDFGLVRSRQQESPVQTRAPSDHAGLTLSRSPRLWWYAKSATSDPVQFTLIAKDDFEPTLTLEYSAAQSAGLHRVDLSQHDVVLESEIEYRWYVSLLVDPEQSDENPISAGALRVIPASDPRHRIANETAEAELGHALAKAGIWYDAYDFFATLSLAHPDSKVLERDRDRLYELTQRGD